LYPRAASSTIPVSGDESKSVIGLFCHYLNRQHTVVKSLYGVKLGDKARRRLRGRGGDDGPTRSSSRSSLRDAASASAGCDVKNWKDRWSVVRSCPVRSAVPPRHRCESVLIIRADERTSLYIGASPLTPHSGFPSSYIPSRCRLTSHLLLPVRAGRI